jgi:hypothetical protein
MLIMAKRPAPASFIGDAIAGAVDRDQVQNIFRRIDLNQVSACPKRFLIRSGIPSQYQRSIVSEPARRRPPGKWPNSILILSGGVNMSAAKNTDTGREEKVPAMQRVLDNPFLLLFLGVTMPTVFYILWGIMEIVTIPIAK